MSIVDEQAFNHEIHEIKIKRSTDVALQQLFNISSRIFSNTDGDTVYMLIDARDALKLPLRLLAHDLRALSKRDGEVKPCLTIVLSSASLIEETSRMIRTILERDRVEFFTDMEKARLWLKLEMRRHART